ncbi:MAG: hypothetical protein U1E10_04615 [Bdellovibrionales bacterium]|nr:hypothetical protein [Bdellovibrionales bacterium]
MSLRLGAIAITFLLFTVPLFGSRALGAEAAAAAVDVVTREPMVNPGSVSGVLLEAQEQTQPTVKTEVGPPAQSDVNAEIQSVSQPEERPVFQPEAQPQAPPAAFLSAETPSIAREADLQKLSTLKGLPCLRDLGQEECTLTYAYRAIEFHAIGEEVIARFQRLNGTVNDADVIVMSSHIEDAALNDRINLDESPVIFAQFQQLSGARYEIPKTASEIKRSLGFSEDTPIAAVDWFEILKVHLERTLSTTPTVSDLILDLLGVELNPVVVETD